MARPAGATRWTPELTGELSAIAALGIRRRALVEFAIAHGFAVSAVRSKLDYLRRRNAALDKAPHTHRAFAWQWQPRTSFRTGIAT